MGKRVTFYKRQRAIVDIAAHHHDLTASLRLFFSEASPYFAARFVGYDYSRLGIELMERLDEIDLTSALSILTALEAVFMIDYLQRVYQRRKDVLSRALRQIYHRRKEAPRLDDDIFEAWRENSNVPPRLISELRSAFKFRHWLAHGRYWTPKLGRRYDFNYVFSLADIVLQSFPLEGVGP